MEVNRHGKDHWEMSEMNRIAIQFVANQVPRNGTTEDNSLHYMVAVTNGPQGPGKTIEEI